MKKYLITTLTLLYSFFSFAQEGFVTTGGNAISGTGSVSYSVGQLAYSAYSNGSNLIIEGLQQPVTISGALPISLIYFTATPGDNHTVSLNWSTVSEYNNDYFTIERSKDGIQFEVVKSIPSAGNSNTRMDYSAIDKNPFEGYSFYRLKQTDKDGKSTSSQIEKVYFGETQFSATASPNPTRDIVQLKINGTVNKNWSYYVTDMSGKRLAQGIITNNITPVNFANMPQATYILQVIKDGKIMQTFKIIKSN